MRDRMGRLLIATGQPRQAWPVLVGVLQEQERVLGLNIQTLWRCGV